MTSLTRFAIHRRWWVIVGWLAVILAAQGLSSALGGAAYKDTFSLPHTESGRVADLLTQAGVSSANGATGTVVLRAGSGALTAPPAQLGHALVDVCASGNQVATIHSPWQTIDCSAAAARTAGLPELLNTARGSTTALVIIAWRSQHYDQRLFTNVYRALSTLRSDRLQVEFTGNAFQGQGQQTHGVPPFALGFVAALIILLIVFGTVGAMALPLATAIAALGAGMGTIGILTHVVSVSHITPQLTELMVLGVGVDYALFIVTRHRRNLRGGMTVDDSIVLSLRTSGRAVLFAGSTVCIAILGLIALGVSFFDGMAVGAAVAVGLTMAASLTLLPALLSLLGDRVLSRRHRQAVRAGRYVEDRPSGVWASWSRSVQQHKGMLAMAATAVMLTLAVPFLSLRLGQGDEGNDPAGTTTRAGYDLIAQGFGIGYNSTLEIVVAGPGADDGRYLERVGRAVTRTPGVDATSLQQIPIDPALTLVAFKSTTAPQDARTDALVRHLRGSTLPPIYRGTRNHLYVYGDTAIQVDFAAVLAAKMPLFISAVVGLSFLLLLIAFRSLLIPLTAALMNLLAAGASFGVVVAVFQWGWGSEALGVGKGGPIDAWAPVMFFAILFGLSMDYQVFLVSRIHEEWLRTGDAGRSIRVGQAETGGIITAAAAIMIAVFGGFVLGDLRAIKLFGVGLATAVFLDAFVLRTVLAPALMHLLGRANWFLPTGLQRFTPRLTVDAPARVVDQDVPAADASSLRV